MLCYPERLDTWLVNSSVLSAVSLALPDELTRDSFAGMHNFSFSFPVSFNTFISFQFRTSHYDIHHLNFISQFYSENQLTFQIPWDSRIHLNIIFLIIIKLLWNISEMIINHFCCCFAENWSCCILVNAFLVFGLG